jgi:hypothetical protein
MLLESTRLKPSLRLSPLVVLLLALAACGPDAKAPVPIGFTGRCKLDVHHEPGGYMATAFYTPDELKTHVTLDVVKDTLVAIHVDLPDTRNSSTLDRLPDNALLVGDAKPDVLLDRDGDVDVPISLRRKDGGEAEPWDLSVRIRFRGDHAEVVAGRMIATGPCVRPPPP